MLSMTTRFHRSMAMPASISTYFLSHFVTLNIETTTGRYYHIIKSEEGAKNLDKNKTKNITTSAMSAFYIL
jgi:hypothetical protein